jgi:predicted nucleic acid-binding protein
MEAVASIVKKERYYLDTSVWNGVKEPAFMFDTEMFFGMIDRNRVICLYSDIVENELMGAPGVVKTRFMSVPDKYKEKVVVTDGILRLAEVYVNEGVVGKTSFKDCVHIAAATVHKADILVSWNFKHMVNLRRVRGYNSINARLGYPILEIRSPREVLDYGI